jgi:hypothetical protein
MVIFHSYVKLPEGTSTKWWILQKTWINWKNMARSTNGSILQKTNKRIGLDQQVGFKKNFIWLVVEPYPSGKWWSQLVLWHSQLNGKMFNSCYKAPTRMVQHFKWAIEPCPYVQQVQRTNKNMECNVGTWPRQDEMIGWISPASLEKGLHSGTKETWLENIPWFYMFFPWKHPFWIPSHAIYVLIMGRFPSHCPNRFLSVSLVSFAANVCLLFSNNSLIWNLWLFV